MELKPIAEFKSCCCGPKTAVFEKKQEGARGFSAREIAVFAVGLAVW